MSQAYPDATQIACAVRNAEVSAKALVADTLARIETQNQRLNCFTAVTAETAMADAESIDRAITQGDDPGVLAGVPFAVKNLFDIAGLTTLQGAKINAENPPATQDATAVA